MTIRVHYVCEGPPPEETLGMAVCINRAGDLTAVTQFNTHCFKSSEDISSYHLAPFRTRPGTEGTIEAVIDPVQMNKGDYFLSVGLLPNLHDQWGFYEYHHMGYEFKVANTGFINGGFYSPMVQWRHQPVVKRTLAA
jgi:hypothetical protein